MRIVTSRTAAQTMDEVRRQLWREVATPGALDLTDWLSIAEDLREVTQYAEDKAKALEGEAR